MASVEERLSALERDVGGIKGAIASLNESSETPFSPVRPGLQRVPSEGRFGIPPMMRQGSGGSIFGSNQPITPRGSGRRSRRRKNKKGLNRRKTQQRRA